jgi:hypothetical protein
MLLSRACGAQISSHRYHRRIASHPIGLLTSVVIMSQLAKLKAVVHPYLLRAHSSVTSSSLIASQQQQQDQLTGVSIALVGGTCSAAVAAAPSRVWVYSSVVTHGGLRQKKPEQHLSMRDTLTLTQLRAHLVL